jgi:hypothetical protein
VHVPASSSSNSTGHLQLKLAAGSCLSPPAAGSIKQRRQTLTAAAAAAAAADINAQVLLLLLFVHDPVLSCPGIYYGYIPGMTMLWQHTNSAQQ